MKKIIKGSLLFLAVYVISVAFFFYFKIIWMSPSPYQSSEYRSLSTAIMTLDEYDSIIDTHKRPYIYSIKSNSGGEAVIVGVDHIKTPNHPQLDSLKKTWIKTTPSVALVEGRLGFLFTLIQNPVEEYGESGLTVSLAKRDGAKLYSWEPSREDEIAILLKDYPAEQLAMFYTFRPYFSNIRYGVPENPEETLQKYLEERTSLPGIQGIYTSWEELDQIWSSEFPTIDWRTHSDQFGWPKGYLSDIAEVSNMARDLHLIQIILDLVSRGETVFITMGVSHAPRIEATLKEAIN